MEEAGCQCLPSLHPPGIGAITTLLRQVEYQDIQLRKGNMEKEKLKKELQDRKHQLLAMSDKVDFQLACTPEAAGPPLSVCPTSLLHVPPHFLVPMPRLFPSALPPACVPLP